MRPFYETFNPAPAGPGLDQDWTGTGPGLRWNARKTLPAGVFVCEGVKEIYIAEALR